MHLFHRWVATPSTGCMLYLCACCPRGYRLSARGRRIYFSR